MSTSVIIGICLAASITVLGVFKMELIKSMVSKITEGKGSINFLSILILIMVAVVPAIIGYAIKPDITEVEDSLIAEGSDSDLKKSDLEVGVEAAKYGIEKGGELIAKRKEKKEKEKKEKEDSVFNAQRTKRWVYKISDWIEDEDEIERFYESHKEIEMLALLKEKKRYFFFQNIDQDQDVANENLSSFKTNMKVPTSITVYDLLEKCDDSNDKLVQVNSFRIGKRRNRVEIPCFEIKR